MKTRQKIAILAKINDYKGDTGKEWFVYYSYRDPATNKMVRFRVYEGFGKDEGTFAKFSIPCLPTVLENILPQKNFKNSQKGLNLR